MVMWVSEDLLYQVQWCTGSGSERTNTQGVYIFNLIARHVHLENGHVHFESGHVHFSLDIHPMGNICICVVKQSTPLN